MSDISYNSDDEESKAPQIHRVQAAPQTTTSELAAGKVYFIVYI